LLQTLAHYRHSLHRDQQPVTDATLQHFLKQEIDKLATTLSKLDTGIVRIGVFGLVSRGKSALLNALVGEPILTTGPTHGVTQQPVVLQWRPQGGLVPRQRAITAANTGSMQIELIDTPGLDEVDGQTRATMAREVASQCDLILFVIAGDLTRTEYEALCELRQAQKPLILVFNKIDLYPEQTRQAIYRNLLQLAARWGDSQQLQQLITENEIVLVAADPKPVQVRIEHADGRIDYEWEPLPPQIEALSAKILTILQREGQALLALNALTQARDAELRMSQRIVEARQVEADVLIWKFTRYKALAVGLNPLGFLDFVGGTLSDLAMIRALSRLYGLPMTRYEAGKLLKTILLSSGSLLASEVISGIVMGVGKGAATIAEGGPSFTTWAGMGAFQAGIAAYGSYSVGRATQVYLEQGCTWGQKGANTVIQEILDQVDANTIIYRIQQDLLS
jgi:small GTP-binding protein